MRNVAQCIRFLQDPLLMSKQTNFYDSVLQNELIKLLADHYNVQQVILYLSFMQVPVSIKIHTLRSEFIK